MHKIAHITCGSVESRNAKVNERNWFFAKDIYQCLDLDIEAGRNAVYQLDIDELQVLDLAKFGGTGRTTLINEPGLYMLMMTFTRKDAGERFRKWVISEALPSLNAEAPQPAPEPDAEVVVSSHDLATLIKRRPNNLKRTIERLAEKGKISQPSTGHQMVADGRGRTRSNVIYHLSHRDAAVVASYLDPGCAVPLSKTKPAHAPGLLAVRSRAEQCAAQRHRVRTHHEQPRNCGTVQKAAPGCAT